MAYRTPAEAPLALSSDDAPRTTAKSRIVSVLLLIVAAPILAALCVPRSAAAIRLGSDVTVHTNAETPLLRLADLLRVKPISPRALNFELLATELHVHRELAFAIDDRVCRATDSSPDVVCSARPAEDPPSFVTKTQKTGPRMVRDDLFGWAHRRPDGSTVTLTYRAEYKDRLRLAFDGAHETMLSPPRGVETGPLYYAASLVPGFVMFRGADEAGELHLFAQPLRAADVGAVEDLGTIGPWYAVGTSHQMVSCDSGEALTVAVKGRPDAEGTYRWFVATNRGGTWTKPAMVFEFDNITCRHGEVSLTRVTGHADDVIQQSTCANGSCAVQEAQLPASPERGAVMTDTAMVTVARKDRRIYLRVGAIDTVAEAPDRLLFDGGEVGAEGWLGGFEVLPAGSAAAVLVSTTHGTFVVRIDGSGSVKPLNAR